MTKPDAARFVPEEGISPASHNHAVTQFAILKLVELIPL